MNNKAILSVYICVIMVICGKTNLLCLLFVFMINCYAIWYKGIQTMHKPKNHKGYMILESNMYFKMSRIFVEQL